MAKGSESFALDFLVDDGPMSHPMVGLLCPRTCLAGRSNQKGTQSLDSPDGFLPQRSKHCHRRLLPCQPRLLPVGGSKQPHHLGTICADGTWRPHPRN